MHRAWKFIRAVVEHDLCPKDIRQQLFEANIEGPLLALKTCCKQFGIGGSLELLEGALGQLHEPLTVAWPLLHKWLLEHARAHDLGVLQRQRKALPDFYNVHWGAGGKLLAGLHLTEDRQAALRGVMCGDAVPGAAAARWGGQELCDCGQPETLFHRWWLCPRREGLRLRILGLVQVQTLLAELGPATLQWGWPTVAPGVAQWQEELQRTHGAVWHEELVAVESAMHEGDMYTDASGANPQEPELRRVAWAVVSKNADGWRRVTGQPPPPHTVARGELAAVVWATMYGSMSVIYTDCKAVAKGSSRVIGDRPLPADLADGPMGDLWLDLWSARRTGRQQRVVWIPAHVGVAQYEAAGLTAAQWEGNAEADRTAKEAAQALSAPAALCC